jgi:hypothetical protein
MKRHNRGRSPPGGLYSSKDPGAGYSIATSYMAIPDSIENQRSSS